MQFLFEEYVKNEQLFDPTERILLALSGGLDSAVMAHLFAVAGLDFGIAHVNFKLRGEASEGDALFVSQLAQKYKVPFFETHFDTKSYAKQNKLSTQMAARALRYAWFEEVASVHQFDKIATAHHLDDSLETVLLNLSKGTGLAGLKGIEAKKNKIVRPLLFATKADITDFAVAQQLSWREDASNQENTYQRNFMRLEVIPLLRKINPDLVHTFQHTAERISLANKALKAQHKALEAKICQYKADYLLIDIKLLEQTPVPLLFLEYILRRYGFQYAQAKQIWQQRHTLSGKTFLSATHQLYKDRDTYLLKARNQETIHTNTNHWLASSQKQLELANQVLHFELFERTQDFTLSKNPQILSIDADLVAFPLEIRIWREGDYFHPLGMKGKKKISDFLIDLKVPLALKKNIYVASSQSEIVGVIGFRLDERYKITSNTKNIYLIKQLEKTHDKSI